MDNPYGMDSWIHGWMDGWMSGMGWDRGRVCLSVCLSERTGTTSGGPVALLACAALAPHATSSL